MSFFNLYNHTFLRAPSDAEARVWLADADSLPESSV
jgi:hypothetical protein